MKHKFSLLSLIFIISLTALKSQNSGNQYFGSSQIHTIKITSTLSVDQLYDSLSYYKDQADISYYNTYI